jgi:hypothetical protein
MLLKILTSGLAPATLDDSPPSVRTGSWTAAKAGRISENIKMTAREFNMAMILSTHCTRHNPSFERLKGQGDCYMLPKILAASPMFGAMPIEWGFTSFGRQKEL